MLAALVLLQALHYYPQLPAVMASHFDGAGRPNGWQTKGAFFATAGGVVLLLLLVFLVLPPSLSRLPPRFVNLPHKAYWLAPERRAESWQWFAGHMATFGCATLLVVLVTFQLAIHANLSGGGTLPSTPMWILLAGYLAFAGAWIVRTYRRFGRPPVGASSV